MKKRPTTTNHSNEAVLFDRISSTVQEGGLSIEMQEEEGLRYAATKGLRVVKVFAVTESGWTPEDRKVFQRMLAYCLENNIRIVIARDTERLARNYTDAARILDVCIKKEGFRFHLHFENCIVGPDSTPQERMMFMFKCTMATNHSDVLSKKISAVHAKKRSQGIPHSIPWGYQWDAKQNRIVVNEELRDTLKYIFDTFDSGRYTIRTLADHLNEKGIKAPKGGNWKRSSGQIHSLLTNPFYHGELASSQGDVVPGKQEPLYSKDVYERRMQLLRNRYAPRKERKKRFHFANILRCSCGRTFTGHEIPIKAAGGQRKPVVHYVHKCDHLAGKQVTLRESRLVDMITSRLAELCFDSNFAAALSESFRRYSQRKRSDKAIEMARLTTKITSAQSAISRLLDLTGGISQEHLIAKIKEKEREIAFLQEKAKTVESAPAKTLDSILETIKRVERAPSVFANSPIEEKAQFLRRTAQLVIYAEGQIMFQFHEPISWLLTDAMVAASSQAKVRKSLKMLPR